MKYKCMIVEDNILERDLLEMKLKKIETLQIKAVLSNGLQAAAVLRSEPIDIVFSDIDMPELSGIELLKSLKQPPVFIFVSSHPEHAAESFDLDVVDYLVKPVKTERLLKAVDKAIEYLNAKDNLLPDTKSSQDQAVSDVVRTIDAQDYFFVKENNTYIKINMGDVLFIESMGDFSRINTLQQKCYMVLISMKNLEKQLSADIFLRVHKQYMVNVLHIRNISPAEIRLVNNLAIPVSISYKQSLMDNLINRKTLTRFIE